MQPSVECVIRGDTLSPHTAITIPCKNNHVYCRGCLKDLFLRATVDERLVPPSCDHEPIPLALAQPLLITSEIILFKAKEVEFGTTQRLYCFVKTCSKFLGPASTSEKTSVKCGACGSSTCKARKGE